jgi:hypothetical protein
MRIGSVVSILIVIFLVGCGSDGSGGGNAPSSVASGSGQGGSTARFTMSGDYLYTLSGYQLKTFNIETPSDPKISHNIDLAWNVETLFSYKDNLFVGSTTGVFIYDISTPAFPKYQSQFSHIRSCDPVVVQDNVAYVTLRNTSTCRGTVNQLDVLDMTSLTAPKLIKSYPMSAPYGLAIDGEDLFICDGEAGLKWFNVHDPQNIRPVLQGQRDDVKCSDLIARNPLLITTGERGIEQLDYTSTPMTSLSTIKIAIQDKPS